MSLHLRWTVSFLLTAVLLTGVSSCGQKSSRPLPASISSYVYAFTSGVISRTDAVRVRFASAVTDESQVGEAAPGILSFSPAIEGEASWEDVYTLRFQPASMLPSSTGYVATVDLQEVYPQVPSEATSFDFEFRTRDQFFEVKVEGLSAPDYSDLSRQELQGRILTTDAAPAEKVEALLNAQQNGTALTITWTHSSDRLAHPFTITGIRRAKETDNQVTLRWNGRPLSVDLQGDRAIEVPALNNFKITGAEVVQEEDQYILVHFSDPLQEDQNLEGLVSIDEFDGGLRFLVDGSRLRLYPDQRLVGNQRIRVNPGIRNINDSRMSRPSEWTVQFTEIRPQVRLVGQGVIMPTSKGLIFPFEAVSLKAVELEVFKIYDNNILQFLQSNELDGSNELYRVGRIILQRRISLASLNPGVSTGNWTRYALDLGDLIEEDPEAIYQIRLGFRQEYATYYCGDQNEEDANTGLTRLEETSFNESGEINSIMENWYGFEGYYEGYDWQHRDDPCFPAYYNSQHFVQRNVIASNLGIIAKGGKDNSYLLTITDLRTAEPVSGASLAFYDFQQQPIGRTQTDAQGTALIQLDRKPFVVIARQEQQKGYLRLEDGASLSMSRFDVSGAVTQQGMKGFLYGDRGVWRPGDSVFLNFILEDTEGVLPTGYPVNFELYDPRGQLQEKRPVAENVNSVYPLYFATARDAPTGNWLARVRAGGATFDKTVKIETVKPNRIEIDLDFGLETLQATAEPIEAGLQANWLHGAPAAKLTARVEAELVARNTIFPDYPDYEFDDPARRLSSEPRVLYDGALDGQGQATFRFSLLGNQEAPGKLTANFKTRVFEKGGDFSTDNLSVPYEPYTAYAGIGLPVNQQQEKRIEVDKPGELRLLSVDPSGKPLAGRRLSVGLYRVEWRWWWENGSDNLSRFSSGNHFDALERTEMVTDGKGEASWSVTPEEWGRFLVRVCDTETGHCSGDYFYAGYPWYGDDDREYRQAAAMLSFTSDKETYQVDEKVTLSIPTGRLGRAFITLENGTSVVESFWRESTEGENTFTFRTTPEMAPNVYAHVTLLQPHSQVENDLPIRMYGVIPIRVEDPSTRLSPQLRMPDELKPKETFTVEVSEENGRPMAYTLAVVDEGLLGLTRFKTPSPWDAFYAKEALGVHTWDVYDQVLGAYGDELERVLSIGGDGEVTPEPDQDQANRFEPVVRHLGPFWLEKGRKARHEIAMPNYVGAVRTMLVAANQGAYGKADKTTPVRNPLMILATLPRVLGPGESLQLPVNVFAMKDNVRDVTVEVETAGGLATIEGPARQSIRFSQPGDQLVTFDLRVLENTGVARFRIKASGGGETASQEIEIQVRNPNPMVTEVKSGLLDPGQEWQVSFSPLGMKGTNEGVLEVSNIPPINLGERLDYLLRYPYGCLEQTLSGGFPQLYVGKLLELDERQKEQVPKNIRATISRLKQFQTGAGGFAYWPGHGMPDHWSTSYAGHFLLEAKAQGYTVPPALLQKWIGFQQKAARIWKPELEEYGFYSRSQQQLNQAYRLYTLALARQPDLAAMNRLRESNNLGTTARWRLAAAYALSGRPEVAGQLTKGLTTQVDAYQELAYTYGSGLRDQAMILETLLLMDNRTAATELVRDISEQLSYDRWLSTQSIGYSLLAIGKFVGDTEIDDSFAFTYQIGGGQTVNAGSSTPLMQVEVPIDGGSGRSLLVSNPGQATLFARLILRGRPLTGDQTVRSNNLRMEIAYRDMNGNSIDPARLPQGTDFVAEVRVIHPNTRGIPYEELAIDQIFPSGWEIINTRMDNLQNFEEPDQPEYRDFRDDRVYTFFDLPREEQKTFRVQLNAAYRGRFYLPPVSCEAMYDHTISASRPGRWVEVVLPGPS